MTTSNWLLYMFGALSLFVGFIYGTPELEQLCEVLLLLSFLYHTKKNSYENIVLFGFVTGASFEFIDELYHVNDRLYLGDYAFTGLWITLTLGRLYYVYNKQTK